MGAIQQSIDAMTGRQPVMHYPPEIEDACRKALEYARICIRKFENTPFNIGGNIRTVECQTVYRGIPIFGLAQYPGFDIAGVTSDRPGWDVEILLGHKRGDPSAIHYPTACHEGGHGYGFKVWERFLWVFKRKHPIYGHDSRWDDMFEGWKETRDATGVSVGGPPPLAKATHIDYVDKAGNFSHADIVSYPVIAAGAMEEPSA